MTPGFTLHTTNHQPPETIGKQVIYRLFESERKGFATANDMNWFIDGPKSPSESARVIEYKVVIA
jgi:hypothetical protein